MTTHQGLINEIVKNPVTAVTQGNYGQNVIIPLLYSRRFPKEKVLVVTQNEADVDIFSTAYNTLSKKEHAGKYVSTNTLLKKPKDQVTFQGSFKIYKLLLEENNLKTLARFSLIFIDGVGSGNLYTDLIFVLFLYRIGGTFRGRVVLNGRSVNYPFENIYFYQQKRISLENSNNPIIEYYENSYPPTPGLNRRMLRNFAEYIRGKLYLNRLSGVVKGNVVVFMPGIGEIKFLLEQLGKIPDHRLIELSGKNMGTDVLKLLFAPKGNIILTTNIIHSIIGIPNIRIVFDSMQEKTPIIMQNGVSLITTTNITKQEATSRALMAYNTSGFGYAFRFIKKVSFSRFEASRRESYSKEHLYRHVLDFIKHDIPLNKLNAVTKDSVIQYAIQDLERFEYLEDSKILNDYQQIFGILIERLIGNFTAYLSEHPYNTYSDKKKDSYHFCYISICAIVSEFRRGYLLYPSGETNKYFENTFKKFEGPNELLTYLNVVIRGEELLLENFRMMKKRLSTFCSENSLNFEEVKRLFVKIKKVIQENDISFTPGILSQEDYVELSNLFSGEYAQYKPNSIFKRKGGNYTYSTQQYTYTYNYDRNYTAAPIKKKYEADKIVVFSATTIRKGKNDGFIRFSVPFETVRQFKKEIKLTLIETPLLRLDASNLKYLELPLPGLKLPNILQDPLQGNWDINEKFYTEDIYPEYFLTKEAAISAWKKEKLYPIYRKHINILEFQTYIPKINHDIFKIPGINSTFYVEDLQDNININIEQNERMNRLHFDLAQTDLVRDLPLTDDSPDKKWYRNRTKLIRKSLVPFEQGYRLDRDLLEENVKPFRTYPPITALTGIIDFLLPDVEVKIFEPHPFYGELLFVALEQHSRLGIEYTTLGEYKRVGLPEISELYIDIIEATTRTFALQDENWETFLSNQTNFRVQKLADGVNFFFLRYLEEYAKDNNDFWESFDQSINYAEDWVVIWIENSQDYISINQDISKTKGLSYYGVIRFDEGQYFWVYRFSEQGEEFGFE